MQTPMAAIAVQASTHSVAFKAIVSSFVCLAGLRRDALTLLVCSDEGGSVGLEGRLKSLGWGTLANVGLGEPGLLGIELTDLSSADIGVLDGAGSDNLNRFRVGTMSSGHLHVHLGDGTAKGSVSVLLVHVDGTSTGQVSKNDSVVSDNASLLLEDFAGGDDLSLDLSNLVLSLHVIPELGSGEDGVRGEHTHSVKLGLGSLLRGVSSSDNVKLSDL